MYTQGTKAEIEFARIFCTQLTSNMKHQNNDIDGFFKNGDSVSIKHQTCFHYCKAFNFELMLENPDTGETIDGNFRYNKAKYTAHKAGHDEWWVFLTSDLKGWFGVYGDVCKVLKTKPKTETANKSWGAGKYRRSHCAIVHLADIKHLAVMQYSPRKHSWGLFNQAFFDKKAPVLTPVQSKEVREAQRKAAIGGVANLRRLLNIKREELKNETL